MIYIYDILLNFNKELIEYFEWKDNDNIKYAKKITLFKVTKKTINDFVKNEIELDPKFIKDTLKYELDGRCNNSYYTLITDGEMVIGISIKNNKLDMVSRLLIDEEEEVLELSDRLNCIKINYKIIKAKVKDKLLLTRKEKKLRDILLCEIKKLYKNNDLDKLSYLYYEYTGKEKKNLEYLYNFFINSLDNITKKHEKLNDILKLSSKK